jgi:hypothetical protein
MRSTDFSTWSPNAIACLEYAYYPELMLTFLLDADTPQDSYAYDSRPRPCKTLIQLFERAYPRELAQIKSEIGLQIWNSRPHVWGWHGDAEGLISDTLWNARPQKSGIAVDDVACALVAGDPVAHFLTDLGVNPGAIGQGLRAAVHHGARKVGPEHLTTAYHSQLQSKGVYYDCVCPRIIEDRLITGRSDGVLEVFSMPFLDSEREIMINPAGPVTHISDPGPYGEDMVIAVASTDLVRRVMVGGGTLGPAVRLGAPVTALDLVSATTAVVSTADGRLSALDLVQGAVLHSRKLTGGPATSVTAIGWLNSTEALVLTTNDRTVRAWNARNLRGAREWHLPETVPYQKSAWGAVPVRKATSCGTANSVIVAGTDEEMFAVFRAAAEGKNARAAETLISDPEYNGFRNGRCIAVRMDGDEALLCTTHVSRIVKFPELTRGVVPLRAGTMCCQVRAQHVATSPGLKAVVLLDSPSAAVLLRSRLIDVTPDLETGLMAIQNWR